MASSPARRLSRGADGVIVDARLRRYARVCVCVCKAVTAGNKNCW